MPRTRNHSRFKCAHVIVAASLIVFAIISIASYEMWGSILWTPQVGPHSFVVAHLTHGEVLQLEPEKNFIITCPASPHPAYIFQDTNAFASGAYVYEYSQSYTDEKNGIWNGKRVRPGFTSTLSTLSAGRTYFAGVENAMPFRCSVPVEFGGLEPGNVFFVDGANGNDAYDGHSELSAFQTLSRAQAAVRAHIASGMPEDVMVLIRDGTYYDAHLDFIPADSGRNGSTVIWRNYPGENPHLVGGVPVTTPWQEDGTNIYKTNIGAGRNFDIMYRNDGFLLNARYPNENSGIWTHAEATSSPKTSFKFGTGELLQSFLDCFSPAPMPTCGDMTDTKVIVWPSTWSTNVVRIASIDDNSSSPYYRTISLARPMTQGITNPQTTFQIIGHRTLLDASGEYFYDRTTGELYLYAGSAPQQETVFIPTRDSVFAFRGTKSQRVENIRLEGLEMSGTDTVDEFVGNIPQGYYVPMDQIMPSTDLAMVVLENARNIGLYNNRIHHAGMIGVSLAGLTDNNILYGNTIEYSGHAAILMNGDYLLHGQDSLIDMPLANILTQHDLFIEQSKVTMRNAIVNNDILESNRLLKGYSAIVVMQSGENLIMHNNIRGAGYAAINLRGQEIFTLGARVQLPIHTGFDWHAMNHAARNVIAYNDISQVMQYGNDGGAFYSDNSGIGNLIFQNDFHDIDVKDNDEEEMEDSHINVIYLDQESAYFQVANNIIRDLDIEPSDDPCAHSDPFNSGCGVPIQASGNFNFFENNVIEQSNWIWAWSVLSGEGGVGNSFAKNIVYKRSPLSYPAFLSFIPGYILDKRDFSASEISRSWNAAYGQNISVEATAAELDRNLFYNGQNDNYGLRLAGMQYLNSAWNYDDVAWETWRASGSPFDQNSVVGVDPQFADPDTGDYSLLPGSPAHAMGIVSIDSSRMGRLPAGFDGIVPVSILPLYINTPQFTLSYILADDPARTVRSRTFQLTEGENAIVLSDTNGAGNTVTFSHRVTLDTAAPDVQILNPLPTASIAPSQYVFVKFQIDGATPFWKRYGYFSNQTYTGKQAFYDRAGNRTVPNNGTGIVFSAQ